jgi:hypothetical protein
VTAAAPLRAWLDERRAEIEHDHRDSWTGNPNTCYCDVPRPCADRARELEAVDGLVAVLDEREALLAWVAVMEAHPWIEVNARAAADSAARYCPDCDCPHTSLAHAIRCLSTEGA